VNILKSVFLISSAVLMCALFLFACEEKQPPKEAAGTIPAGAASDEDVSTGEATAVAGGLKLMLFEDFDPEELQAVPAGTAEERIKRPAEPSEEDSAKNLEDLPEAPLKIK